MTPYHALFRRLFAVCQEVMDTYDYLPDSQARYPFCYIGESVSREAKNNDLYGEINQTLHLYGLREMRGRLLGLSGRIEDQLKGLEAGYGYHFKLLGVSVQLVPDNSDVTPLLHLILDTNYLYTKKGN